MGITLELKNIDKSFDGLKIINNLSFKLQKETITGLFGENGSGKTTLFNIISGFLKPDSGEIVYKEKLLISNYSPSEISKAGIGKVWQKPRVFMNLSLEDNLLVASTQHPGINFLNYIINPIDIFKKENSLKEKAKYLIEDVGLLNDSNKVAGELSFGQQKLLSIAMLLMNDSDLLMLDEPFAGVHLKMIEHISEVLLSLKNQGRQFI
ncbi:MAG: ATP-binding cassette domain-containing protein [Ignavibacteria bacterium]|nr:ATP-binding cassette domain-containing protein [Ignavibacteria bacterium]